MRRVLLVGVDVRTSMKEITEMRSILQPHLPDHQLLLMAGVQGIAEITVNEHE